MSNGKYERHMGVHLGKVSRQKNRQSITKGLNELNRSKNHTAVLSRHDLGEVNRELSKILREYTYVVSDPPQFPEGETHPKWGDHQAHTPGDWKKWAVLVVDHNTSVAYITQFCDQLRKCVSACEALDRELELVSTIDYCQFGGENAIREADDWPNEAFVQRQINQIYHRVTEAINGPARKEAS